MLINSPTPILPVTAVDRNATGNHGLTTAHDAVTKAKAAAPTTTQPKVFTPAPPLRPNVQDYVDIDRTLIALRQGY